MKKPTRRKQSSSRLSTIAARLLNQCQTEHAVWKTLGYGGPALGYFSVRDVKALAASVLSQDETPRQGRKKGRKR